MHQVETGEAPSQSVGGQFLTFTLGGESYGVEILAVQEIKGGAAITPIPNAPRHVRGVMNLRGTIIPVVDLRTRLGMPAPEDDRVTVIVVVRVGARTQGLIVDAVSDVLDIAGAEIEPAPDLGNAAGIAFVRGIAKTDGRLVVLLDIERLLAGEDAAA